MIDDSDLPKFNICAFMVIIIFLGSLAFPKISK